jgi:hypothetical protein
MFIFRGCFGVTRRSEALETDFAGSVPAAVASGATSTATVTANEADAARLWVAGWASGSPGSNVILKLANFPAGDVLRVTGGSQQGGAKRTFFQTVTIPSPAPPVVRLKLRIPTGIPLGDDYTFEAKRVGGKLGLTASFQACSLRATQTSIRKGSAVRLSGIVPVALDPMDPDAGTTVILFKRMTASTQPASWCAGGWTKVMTLKTTSGAASSSGAPYFQTPPLRPSRTTWYVVRYHSSGRHNTGSFWRAFTSVQKVRVY